MTPPSYQVSTSWTDLVELTGIAIGTEITIQNQGRGGDVIECAVGTDAPDYAGVSISQFETHRVTSQSNVWVRYVRYDIQAGSYENQARTCKTKILSTNEIQDATALNADLIGGNSALTTQGFSELNSKNGNQYETALLFQNIVSITPVFYGFETGDSPVILKQRDIYGSYVSASYEVFSSASYTGGTAIDAFNNNDLVINPTGVSIVSNPTVTVEGSQFSVITSLIGSEGVGNRLLTSFGAQSGEKILKPNTKYLVKISNLATAAIGSLAVRLYYYEGPLSTQL